MWHSQTGTWATKAQPASPQHRANALTLTVFSFPTLSPKVTATVLSILNPAATRWNDNLATHAAVCQSSQYGEFHARLAVESLYNSQVFANSGPSLARYATASSFAITRHERSPWWECDLGRVIPVNLIRFTHGRVLPVTTVWVLASKEPLGRNGNGLGRARNCADVKVHIDASCDHSGVMQCKVHTHPSLCSNCCVHGECSPTEPLPSLVHSWSDKCTRALHSHPSCRRAVA